MRRRFVHVVGDGDNDVIGDGNNVVDKDNDNDSEGTTDYMNASHDGNAISGNDIQITSWMVAIITVRLLVITK